jgi:hypothetical protein
MMVGSLELGNLGATKSRQGKYEERKEKGKMGGLYSRERLGGALGVTRLPTSFKDSWAVEAAGTFFLSEIAIVNSNMTPGVHLQAVQSGVARSDNSRTTRTGWNSRIKVYSIGISTASSNTLASASTIETSKP